MSKTSAPVLTIPMEQGSPRASPPLAFMPPCSTTPSQGPFCYSLDNISTLAPTPLLLLVGPPQPQVPLISAKGTIVNLLLSLLCSCSSRLLGGLGSKGLSRQERGWRGEAGRQPFPWKLGVLEEGSSQGLRTTTGHAATYSQILPG